MTTEWFCTLVYVDRDGRENQMLLRAPTPEAIGTRVADQVARAIRSGAGRLTILPIHPAYVQKVDG